MAEYVKAVQIRSGVLRPATVMSPGSMGCRLSGMLAEAVFDAYVKAPRHGTENIRRVIFADDPSDVELVGDHAAAVLAPEWR